MTTVDSALSGLPVSGATTEVSAPASQRIVSIDIFRGITMAVMIFVNELSGVRGMPWWTEHAPGRLDFMTYVDMVFPFFLFAVGLSLPLSVAQRLRRNPSQVALWWHIVTRSVALVVLGLILANAEKATKMPISGSAWGLLGLIFAALYLAAYGKSERAKKIGRILRIVGFVGVVVLYAIYSRTTRSGQAAWIDFGYPEILGLIGCCYLGVSILYIPTRRWKWAPAAWFLLLTALCIVNAAKWISFPRGIPIYLWPLGNGAESSLMMAGVMVSGLFLPIGRSAEPKKATWIAIGIAVVTFVAAFLLSPLGISKIRATPTWELYCVAGAAAMFTLLYWICDVKKWQSWAWLVRPAGENTLTTYLLPDLWDYVLGVTGITFLGAWGAGWPGVARTAIFTLLILLISRVLTRAKIRLQL